MILKKYISFQGAAGLIGCGRTHIYYIAAMAKLQVFEVPPFKFLLRSEVKKLSKRRRKANG